MLNAGMVGSGHPGRSFMGSWDHVHCEPFRCPNELACSQVSTQTCAQEVLSETSEPLDPAKEAAYLPPQPVEIPLKGESQDPQHQGCG